jgi:hypothetical protein
MRFQVTPTMSLDRDSATIRLSHYSIEVGNHSFDGPRQAYSPLVATHSRCSLVRSPQAGQANARLALQP